MAIEGIFIAGQNGGGKSSGSGFLISMKLMSAGWGGLVLTVKPEEAQMWKEYCRLAKRDDDLLIIEPGGKQYFNFLEYESIKKTGGASLTDNIVEVLKTVIGAGQEQNGGKNQDPFWEAASDMLMASIIDLCKLAYGHVTVMRMFDIVQTIPKSLDVLQDETTSAKPKAFAQAFETARNFVTSQIDSWVASLSEQEQDRLTDDAVFETELLEAIPDARLLKHLDQFFFDNFIPLSDKTRSIIDFSFAAFLAPTGAGTGLFPVLSSQFNSDPGRQSARKNHSD